MAARNAVGSLSVACLALSPNSSPEGLDELDFEVVFDLVTLAEF